MAFKVQHPAGLEQGGMPLIWLTKKKVIAVEYSIGPQNGFTYALFFHISNDGGRTWKYLPDSGAYVTGDGSLYKRPMNPTVWMDKNQNIYAMLMDFGGRGYNCYFMWYKLDGDNWQARDGNRVINGNGAITGSNYMVVDADDKIFEVFMRNAGNNGDIIVYEHQGVNRATRVDQNWLKYNLQHTVASGNYRSQRCMYATQINGKLWTFYGWAEISGNNLEIKVSRYVAPVNWAEQHNTTTPAAGHQAIATFTKGAEGRFMDFMHGAVRSDNTVVLAMADAAGQFVKYAIYDVNSNGFDDLDPGTAGIQTVGTLFTNPGSVVGTGNYGMLGPVVQSDGKNTIIMWAYLDRRPYNATTAPTGGKWVVASRRLLADNTLEAIKTYEVFNDHVYMQNGGSAYETSAIAGPGGGRPYGPYNAQSVMYDKAAFHYPNQAFTSNQRIQQIQFVDNNYPPFQATGRLLSNSETTSTIEPTVGWNFMDPNEEDTAQYAFQLQVIDPATSATIYDSGKIISPDTQRTIYGASPAIAFNKFYQWRVKTWDETDTASPWSTTFLFKTTQAPTGSIDVPSANGTLTTDTPTIEWTYAQSAGLAQKGFQVQIYSFNNDKLVYDSGFVPGVSDQHDIPKGVFENNQTYYIDVFLTSSENAVGQLTRNYFNIQFVAPPTPGVTVATNDEEQYNLLQISQTVPGVNALSVDIMRIYRAKTGDSAGYKLIRDNVAVIDRVIDNFEVAPVWVAKSGQTAATLSTNSKQGDYSVNFAAKSGQEESRYTFDNYDTTGTSSADYSDYDKVHVWVYLGAATKEKIRLLRFRFGLDETNYFQYDHDISYMTNNAWNLLNIPFNTARIFGVPTLSELNYVSFDVQLTTAGQTSGIALGDLKLDQLRLLKDNVEIRDYDVENDGEYVYKVVTVNLEDKLESGPAITPTVKNRFREEMPILQNTFLTPLENEQIQIKAWMDGTDPPSWENNTEVKYYQPKGAVKPIAFSNGVQKYREGKVTLKFFDPKFKGEGLAGVEKLEQIASYKPMLLRTWWGRNYRISIDGKITVTRKPGIGYEVSFNFTEVQ